MGTFGTITLGGTCVGGVCDCISYSYDRSSDFIQDDDEIFGFRLNGTEIERDTNAATCAGGAGWQAVTDDEVNIEVLSFELDPDSTIMELDDGVGDDDGTCESGEVCLARRKINVVLEGSLAADSDFTVRLRDEIKVKNDHYYTMP